MARKKKAKVVSKLETREEVRLRKKRESAANYSAKLGRLKRLNAGG